jgi:acyl-CoA reductase-like NAD-dependent aldehyde dehydrogenase
VVAIGSLDEAIEQTNGQPYGLMAAIFTADLAAGMRYADSVQMGLVNINETTNYWEPHLPWGGGGPLPERYRARRRRASDGDADRAADRAL